MKKKESIFLISLFLNSFGNNFYYIALPLIVYNISKSAASMGIMGVIEVIPILLFGPLIGTYVDRSNLKKVLSISSLIQAVLVLGVCAISKFELNILYLYVLGAMIAINVQFFKVSMFSSIPFIFKNIEKGNAKISSINSFSELFSPFVASILIAQFNINAVFVLNSLTSILFFMATIKFLEMRVRSNVGFEKKDKFFEAALQGIKSIKTNRPLILLICIISISNLGDAGLIQLLMFHMANDYNLSNSLITLIIGSSGFGAFIGTLVPYFFRGSSIGKRLFWGLIINNIGVFLLLVNHWSIIPIALLVCNFGGMIYYIAQSTLIQLLSDEYMIGRINGTVRLLVQITKPISLSILMFVANQYGSYFGIMVSVGITIINTIFLLLSKLKEMNFKEFEKDEL